MVISLLFSLYDLKTRVPYSCDGLSKWQNITFSVKEFYFHVSGHNSPLFGRREEDEVEHPGHNFNVNDTIAWWLSQVSPQKELQHFLPPGSPGWEADRWYAHIWAWLGAHGWKWGVKLTFKMKKTMNLSFLQNGLFCLTAANSPKGPYTGQLGFLGYYEILQALNNDTWA